jgi:hypothetical protein
MGRSPLEDFDYGPSRRYSSATLYVLAAFALVIALIEISLDPSKNVGWCSAC